MRAFSIFRHRVFIRLPRAALIVALSMAATDAPCQTFLSEASPSYTQGFDSLSSAGTGIPWADNSTLPAWYASRSLGGPAWAAYRADYGFSNTGSIYSFGSTGSAERAFGSIASGTPGNIAYGLRLKNSDSMDILQLRVAYTGEQWRNGGNINYHALTFYYCVSSSAFGSPLTTNPPAGGYTAYAPLTFTGPVAGGVATALDGNTSPNRTLIASPLPVLVPPGSEVSLLWYDINDSGNDHGLAVDNLTITAGFGKNLYVDGSRPDNSGDGLSWATAKKTLQGGIDAAPGGAEVWAKGGVYAEAIVMKSQVALYGGFGGWESSLAQRDITSYTTVIDASTAGAGGGPAYHAVTIDTISSPTLDGMVITGGLANGSGPTEQGGGIYCVMTNSVLIANCVITTNSAHYGGGVYSYWTGLAITSSTICGNGANTGAGIYACQGGTQQISYSRIEDNQSANSGGGAYFTFFSATLTNCSISRNKALGSNGGGVYCEDGTAAFTDCLIESNTASTGGAVYANTNGNVAFSGCRIAGNSAGMSSTGGVYVLFANLSLVNSAVLNNAGGGVRFGGNGWDYLISNCDISGNHGWQGAGLTFLSADPHPIVNTVFSGNTAVVRGGAILLSNSSAMIANCTISGNSAGVGGGGIQCNNSSPDIRNTIFAGNTLYAIHEIKASSRPTVAYSLFYGNPDGDFCYADTDTRSFAYTGANAIMLNVPGCEALRDGDPMFVSADGAAPDFHLLNGSAALDHGTAAAAPATDIEGTTRPGSDGLVDIGAYEADEAFVPSAADAIEPMSRVLSLPAATTTTVFNVAYLAVDGQSGIQYTRLFYRRGGGLWTQYGGFYTTTSISFNSVLTGGDGYYEFYSLATDNADNDEPPKSAGEAWTVVATAFSGSRVYVNQAATGTGTGEDWPNACPSVAAAIAIAQFYGAGEVWVARGTYYESVSMFSGLGLYGGFAGGETDLGQRDWVHHQTTIDASKARDGLPSWHVVSLINVTTATLDGLALTGGVTHNAPDTDGGGGGVLDNNGAANTISHCAIIGNRAFWGGGIYANSQGLAITSCTIASNASEASGGGALINTYGASIADCVIGGNVSGNQGGGVYHEGASSTMTNCLITGNRAYDGGGVGGIGSSSAIVNCAISDNSADFGGGTYLEVAGAPSFRNTIFSGNVKFASAVAGGGAPSFTSCLFWDNDSGDVFDSGHTTYTGAVAINAIPGNSGNVEGDPLFAMNGARGLRGVWTLSGVYDAASNRTALTAAPGTFGDSALVGCMIAPDQTDPDHRSRQAYVIGNTSATCLVVGDASYAAAGDAWKVCDYRLGYRSAAIDTGTSGAAPLADIRGVARPFDVPLLGASGPDAFDIGAYEAIRADFAPPAAPSDPGATLVATDSITWTWANHATDADGVRLWCGEGPTAPAGPPLATLASDATSYTLPTLTANSQWAFQAAAFNFAGDGAKTPNYTTWTLAAAPVAPLVDNRRESTLDVSIAAGDGNPATTQYAIRLSPAVGGGQWILASGSVGASPVWQTRAAWGSATVLGLRSSTSYAFASRARNGVGIETADSLFTVVSTLVRIYADADSGDDAYDGKSWDQAKETLQAAIDTALALGGGGVWARMGTFPESIAMRSNVAVYGGFAGSESLLAQRNLASNLTILDASHARGGLPAYHAVIMNTLTHARLDGFVVTGGDATGGGSNDNGGGAHCVNSDDTTAIDHCLIAANRARHGGGIMLEVSTTTLANTIFCGNGAEAYGGAAYCNGGSPSFTNCLIAGNSSGAGAGGSGIMCGGASPRIVNCTISSNNSFHLGGAVLCYGNANPFIINVLFEGNTQYAVREYGADTNPVVLNCLFRNNPDGDYFDATGPDRTDGTVLTGAAAINALVNKTGAANSGNVDGDPKFPMNGRRAVTGLWTLHGEFNPATYRTTLTDAPAGFTPGVLVGRLIAPDETTCARALIVSNTSAAIVVIGDASYAAAGDAYRIIDYHLGAGSAAIDAGTSALAPSTDLDGAPRPADVPFIGFSGAAAFDIGAYEAPRPPAANAWRAY